MNPFRAWQELSAEERLSIAWTTVMILVVTVVVLYAIAASRGADVDYFKHRLGLMEARVNYMDQKVDTIAQRQAEQRDHINELRRMTEASQRLQEEQQKWIEHWKNLPQLPKPPQRR